MTALEPVVGARRAAVHAREKIALDDASALGGDLAVEAAQSPGACVGMVSEGVDEGRELDARGADAPADVHAEDGVRAVPGGGLEVFDREEGHEATLAAAARADHVFPAKSKLRDALALLPSKNATTDGVRQAAELARAAADILEQEVAARALDTARRAAGYDPDAKLYDKLGRERSPATMPGYMAGRPAPNRGRKYPADPPTVGEILRLLEHVAAVSKTEAHAERLRALILIVWRAGLRISEALALLETDLNAETGEVFVRCGKGGKSRTIGIDDWVGPLLTSWIGLRRQLPPGPLFCVLEGKLAGVSPWGASCARSKFADLQAAAGIRRRFRPHQLRHAMTCELVMEGKSIVLIQRQLGHANLAVTTNYTAGLPQRHVVDAMRGRAMPTVPAFLAT